MLHTALMEPREHSYDPGEGWKTCDRSEAASDTLTALVRLLARQAALEQFGFMQDEIEQRLTYDSLVRGSDG